MSQKKDLDKELDQEVQKDTWERQFYSEDEEEIDGLTRAQHRARSRKISPIAIVFIVFAVLLIVTPFIMRIYVNSKSSEVPKKDNTQLTVNKNSSSSSKQESSSSSSKEESSEAVSSSEKVTPPVVEEEQPVEEETQEQQPETPASTEKYVTVQQGQGVWRIAHDNGITVEELQALNPGMSNNLSPGQLLRVQ